MNKMLRLLTAVMFVLFTSFPAIAIEGDYGIPIKAGPSPNDLVSMDFQDANLKTVLKIFSQQSGLNFVASENVKNRTVTIYFDNVSVEDALNHIMSASNLVYEQKPGSSIFIVKESGKPVIETLTRIYELKYAQLAPPSTDDKEDEGEEKEPEILPVIRGVLSKNGSIVADKRSNSLIITDVPSQFAIIEQVLERLDVRTQQVMIEAEVIETTTAVADKLGLDWTGTFGTYAGPAHNTLWPLRGNFSKDETASIGEGFSATGSVNLGSMGATLKAIMSDSNTKLLARPKVLTLNNETATIELSASTAVASISQTTSVGTEATTVSAERIDTGIKLKVTPQINKDGYITMHIEPTVVVPLLSKFFQGSGTDAKYIDPHSRSAKTTVMVKDGETVIIGGLISQDNSHAFEKIPFLGDIPILGAAFRYKQADEEGKELLIFITPHIMRESSYALGNISEREQEKPKAVREKKIKNILDLLES